MSRPRLPINHGTVGGARAHFRHGEPMCEPCRDAERKRRGNKPFQPVRCGTRSGYMAHLAKGEASCADCRAAQNAYRRDLSRRGLPDGDHRHGTNLGYRNYGCRCDSCKQAGAIENRRQREARSA